MTPHRVRAWPHSGGGHCTKCGTLILAGEIVTTWCENPGEAERIGHVCPSCDIRAAARLLRPRGFIPWKPRREVRR